MPIQFRCRSCEQMLSIAKRKAGSVVDCPKCRAQVRVPAMAGVAIESPDRTQFEPHIQPVTVTHIPTPDSPTAVESLRFQETAPAPVEPPPPKKPKATPPAKNTDSLPLFERPDFESLLTPQSGKRDEPLPDAEPLAKLPSKSTLPLMQKEPFLQSYLEPKAVLLGVVAAILIGIAFIAGYYLASLTLPTRSGSSTVQQS